MEKQKGIIAIVIGVIILIVTLPVVFLFCCISPSFDGYTGLTYVAAFVGVIVIVWGVIDLTQKR